LLFLGRLVIEPTGLNDLVIDVELKASTGVHSLFDTLLGDKAKNANSLRLANTMSTILSLEIGMRIPITIETADKSSLNNVVHHQTIQKGHT
jgi:hypothetical protein